MRTCILFDDQPKTEIIKINDKIKNDYCEEKYINLIRIRYDEISEIPNILKKTISAYK